jgi:hypothetical protein
MHSIARKSEFPYKSMSYNRLDASADSMRLSPTTSMTYDHVGGADGGPSKTCLQSDGFNRGQAI